MNLLTDNNYGHGIIGNITISDVNTITGSVSLYTGSSAIANVTMTGLQAIGGNVTLTTLAANVNLINMTGVSPWTLGGYLTVTTGYYQQGYINAISLSVCHQ